MHNVIPPIHEEATALKERLQHAHDGHKKPRLQMLYLLASGQARSRQEVAGLLGVHRNTISRWLALYAAGGLEAVLATYVPAGKPVSLVPHVLAGLEQALHRPEGFASYEELCQWVRRTHGEEVKYKTLYSLVRTRFKTKLTVARLTHPQKPPRPCRPSRPPVTHTFSGPSRLPIVVPSGCSAKTKAASAY